MTNVVNIIFSNFFIINKIKKDYLKNITELKPDSQWFLHDFIQPSCWVNQDFLEQ